MDSDSDIEIVPTKSTKPSASQAPPKKIPRPRRVAATKLPSLSPVPVPKVLKRPAGNSIDASAPADTDRDHRRSSKRTHQSASIPPDPPQSSLSPLPSSPDPQEPSHVRQLEDAEDDHGSRKSCPTSPPLKKGTQSQAVIELGSSPLSACDPSSSYAQPRIPIQKNTTQRSSSPLSDLSSKSPKNDNTGESGPSARSDKSAPARLSKEPSASPIPVRKKSQINPPTDSDSSDALSDLGSIFGVSKPGLKPQKPQLSPVDQKSCTFVTGNDSQEGNLQRPNKEILLPALASLLRRHATTSTISNPVGGNNKTLPRSHTAPHKADELRNAVDKGKGKAKQSVETPLSSIDAGEENQLSAPELDDFNFNRDPSPHDRSPSGPSSRHPSPPPAPVNKTTANRIEKQAQAAQARLLREAKKAAKEKEKHDNRLQREANKLTLNRKETVSEVRMYVPKSLKKSKMHPFAKACEVLEERIASTEGCAMNPPGEIDDENSEPKGVVRWVRTATKEWDEDRGIFIPLGSGNSKETSEPTVLVVWTGKEVDEVIASGADQLMKKAQAIKSHYPQDQLFIVISGLETILRAEKRNEDTMITNEARERLAIQRNESNPSTINRTKSKTNLFKNSRDKILKELEVLKIITKAFVIRVEDKNEFANWLWEMTMEIGVRPYKSRKQELKSALRLEVSGTKGTNNEDTYIKMLSSLTRVTENEAKGIVSKFPTIKSLYQSWERGIEKNGLAWAEDMLIGCSKSNAMTAVNTNRKIGKVTSKRIFDIMFNSKNGDACLLIYS
ncbi:hypothetical protein PSHT_14367 [Puccinia striiformis]|uniref:Uncharacterized protein n=1 Tax=Puccinia striiformis TaxID=27350 RepID=A0A2S4UKU0_9BASI|nr:hypothetical protein PSHT_14367 [Puccinia striiformis]